MFHKMINYGLEGLERPPQSAPASSLTRDLVRAHLPAYKRHGELVVVHQEAWQQFKLQMPVPVAEEAENSPLSVDEDELASLVCQAIHKPAQPCRALAVDRGSSEADDSTDNYKLARIKFLLGDSPLVGHKQLCQWPATHSRPTLHRLSTSMRHIGQTKLEQQRERESHSD